MCFNVNFVTCCEQFLFIRTRNIKMTTNHHKHWNEPKHKMQFLFLVILIFLVTLVFLVISAKVNSRIANLLHSFDNLMHIHICRLISVETEKIEPTLDTEITLVRSMSYKLEHIFPNHLFGKYFLIFAGGVNLPAESSGVINNHKWINGYYWFEKSENVFYLP